MRKDKKEFAKHRTIMKVISKMNMRKSTYDPNKEYSGKLVVRFSPDTHRRLAMIASKRSMSINLLLNIMIQEGIRKEAGREKRKAK